MASSVLSEDRTRLSSSWCLEGSPTPMPTLTTCRVTTVHIVIRVGCPMGGGWGKPAVHVRARGLVSFRPVVLRTIGQCVGTGKDCTRRVQGLHLIDAIVFCSSSPNRVRSSMAHSTIFGVSGLPVMGTCAHPADSVIGRGVVPRFADLGFAWKTLGTKSRRQQAGASRPVKALACGGIGGRDRCPRWAA